jgi:peptidoglycan hydrolase-like protein with peptidoglycan-binding domain
MKKLLTGLVALTFVVSPSLASAETSSVQALLDQLKVLQERIAALTTAQTTTQTAKSEVMASLKLIRGLRQGMSGEDVTALQTLLAADTETYPEGIVSGFYGQLTANAVKNFQRKHGIEAVGFVGPKTLQKLNEESETLGLAEVENGSNGIGISKRLCAKVPPGHLIAPGWLRKNGGVAPIVPECQKLPGGIVGRLGSTTPRTGSTTDRVTISNLRANNVSTSTANINWNTNLASDSKVWYSSTSPWVLASSTLVSSTSMVKTHSLNISGLATSTTYYYVAVSTNGSTTATTSPKAFETDEN